MFVQDAKYSFVYHGIKYCGTIHESGNTYIVLNYHTDDDDTPRLEAFNIAEMENVERLNVNLGCTNEFKHDDPKYAIIRNCYENRHNITKRRIANCWHEFACTDCHIAWNTDSSG